MTSGDQSPYHGDSPDYPSGLGELHELPPHDFGIDKRVKGARVSRVSDSVTVRSDTFHFSDGYVHDVLIYQPDDQLFDVGVSMGTPLGTELGIGLCPGGFNSEIAKGLAEDGNVVILSSQNRASLIQSLVTLGGVMLDRDRSPEALTILSHDAYAQCLILDEVDEQDSRTNDRMSVQVGYSRGAMLALGVLAYGAKPEFDRDILYSDCLDPCLEHAVEFERNVFKVMPYLLREVSTLISAVVSSPEMIKLLPETMPLSASRAYQQITSGIDLFRGSVGPLARHVPTDTLMTMRLFDGSILNNDDDWVRLFDRSKYPRVTAVRENGRHMSGAKTGIQNETRRRVLGFQRLYSIGVDPNTILPENILDFSS